MKLTLLDRTARGKKVREQQPLIGDQVEHHVARTSDIGHRKGVTARRQILGMRSNFRGGLLLQLFGKADRVGCFLLLRVLCERYAGKVIVVIPLHRNPRRPRKFDQARNDVRAIRAQSVLNSRVALLARQMRLSGDQTPVAHIERTSGGRSLA